MNESPKLRKTKDYSLFSISDTNRCINSKHVKKLVKVMREYGWIPAFPMLVHRTSNGLEVVDGQHRLWAAKELGLPVWYVETDNGFAVDRINAPQVPWNTKDYAESFAKREMADYAEVIEFAEKNAIPLSISAALLAGTISFANVRQEWKNGTYKIKERDNAELIALICNGITSAIRRKLDRATMLAIIAIAHVRGLNAVRLIKNSKRLAERFIPFATREAALGLLDDIYNHNCRGDKFPLKTAAENAMRERNPANKNK